MNRYVPCSVKRRLLAKKLVLHIFSLHLINNSFCLKCWINYISIFVGSRDVNFITSSYSEVTFLEKCMQHLLKKIEMFSSACVFTFEFMGFTKAKFRNEA